MVGTYQEASGIEEERKGVAKGGNEDACRDLRDQFGMYSARREEANKHFVISDSNILNANRGLFPKHGVKCGDKFFFDFCHEYKEDEHKSCDENYVWEYKGNTLCGLCRLNVYPQSCFNYANCNKRCQNARLHVSGCLVYFVMTKDVDPEEEIYVNYHTHIGHETCM